MSLLPRSLGWRIFAALVVATGGVAALSFAVQANALPERTEPGTGGARGSAGHGVAGVSEAVALTAPTEDFQVQRLAIPFVGGPILLALRPSSLEPTVAPVVQVLKDGGLALRRPAPLAESPGLLAESLERGAAIVLPGAVFADFDARARSAFLELVGQLVRERPVPASRFRTVDFPLPIAELERLLQWLP